MAANTVWDILNVLIERREHCRELLELSRRQRQFISEDNYSELLDTLGRKQRILGKLDALTKRQPELKRDWHAQREAADPALRSECEHVLAETEALFAELLQEENDSTEYLTKRRDATRDQLQAVARGSQVHAAYRDNLAPSTHRHLDVGQ